MNGKEDEMSEMPEVFAIFEQKLANVLSFTVVPLKSNDLKKAIAELLTYFVGMVERASKAESRIAELEAAQLEAELKITDELLKEATETIGAVVACCTYNSNDDAKIGIYGIDQFIIHYNDPISASKVSVDVKTSTDNNKRSKWKAYAPVWGAPTVNKRYLVKLINNWITIATYYLRVGGGYWKDDRGQELVDGVVSLWKELEE